MHEIVSQALFRRFGIEAKTLDPDTKLQSLGIDSLAMTEFSFDLEDQLGFPLPASARYRTLADIFRDAERIAAAKARVQD